MSRLSVGDVVTFTGRYDFATPISIHAIPCRPGKATVTKIDLRANHPFLLIRVKGGTSNVYGWVDETSIYESFEHNEEKENSYE